MSILLLPTILLLISVFPIFIGSLSNIAFTIPAGAPDLVISSGTIQIVVHTVSSGERWIVLNAGATNNTQNSRSAVRWSMDGTNYTGKQVTSAGPGAASAMADLPIFPFMLLPGGKIETTAITFTAGDTVIHHVTIMRIFAFD